LDKKIVVIDLDGTFVSVNTFHKWMKFLFIESIKKFHLIVLIQILISAFLRYLKVIDHSQMKFTILSISEKTMSHQQRVSFVHSLEPYINDKILKVMQNEDDIYILATAAPILYAEIIKKHYPFTYVIATNETNSTDSSAWKENIRDEKKKNLMTLLQKHALNNQISVLYTDHHDDLPLMKCSNITYLVDPSDNTKEIVLDSNITFETI